MNSKVWDNQEEKMCLLSLKHRVKLRLLNNIFAWKWVNRPIRIECKTYGKKQGKICFVALPGHIE